MNTGGVGAGERYKDIKLEYTVAILDSLLREGLEDWVDSSTGFKVPRAIRHVDDIYLHPEKLYSRIEFEEKQEELSKIRREAVEKYDDALPPTIRKAFSETITIY